jgi:hypothetical protein
VLLRKGCSWAFPTPIANSWFFCIAPEAPTRNRISGIASWPAARRCEATHELARTQPHRPISVTADCGGAGLGKLWGNGHGKSPRYAGEIELAYGAELGLGYVLGIAPWAVTHQHHDRYMERGIKTSQRISRSCVECGRRKIKCDKKSPCQPCIRRNAAHECKRPIARVRGQLTVYAATETEDVDYADDEQIRELLRQRAALQAQVAELETALALSKPCAHIHASTSTDYSEAPASLEDLVPAFEQFDIGLKSDSVTHSTTAKEIADQLYEPITDPISLLLPRRKASHQIVNFSLQTLGWLHCAVDSDAFLRAHEDFWESAHLNISLGREQRPWMSIYFALLAVGILYMDPDEMPDVADLPQPGLPLDESVNIAIHTSRLWYEAALKEVERCGCSGIPYLSVVQALSVLTLCHSNFGEHQREWLFTGLATNIARCLDMHKLGTEAAVSKEMCQRQEWSTTAQRELGRRLWWSCVIRDWYVLHTVYRTCTDSLL